MTVRKMCVEGGEVAVVEVLPSMTPPVRFKGRVWIRVGPRRAVASLDEERRLNERRRSLDLPFDSRPIPGSSLDGTLLDVLRQLDEVLELNTTTAVDFTSGRQEERTTDYPLVALQQVARNAVMHRSYEHTTYRSLKANGNPPPEFTVMDSYISVTIRRRP